MTEDKQMTAEFFELASAVMNAPYFYGMPETNDKEKVFAFLDKRNAEKDLLDDALGHCTEYGNLRGEAKKIFDKAKLSIDEWERDYHLRERLCGGDDTLYYGVTQETLDAVGPSPENSALLAAAIAQAVEAGDMAAAEKLAALGKDPDKLQELIDEADEQTPYAEQAAEEEAELPKPKPKGQTVKPSPFRKSLFGAKSEGQPCQQGETAEQSGCVPASSESSNKKPSAGSEKLSSGTPVKFQGGDYVVSGGGIPDKRGPNKGRVPVVLRHSKTNAVRVAFQDQLEIAGDGKRKDRPAEHLTEKETQVLHDWVSSAWDDIQRVERSGKADTNTKVYGMISQEKLDDFHSALDKMPSVEAPIARGLMVFANKVGFFKAGSLYEFNGSQSFSADTKWAERWATGQDERGPQPDRDKISVVLQMEKSKQAKDIRSINPEQSEAVMKHKSVVRITNVTERNGVVYVSMKDES